MPIYHIRNAVNIGSSAILYRSSYTNDFQVILTFASIDTGMQDALSAFFFLHLSLQSTYSLH